MEFIGLFIGLLRFISAVLCRGLLLSVSYYGLPFWMLIRLATSRLYLVAKSLPRLLLRVLCTLDYPSYKINLLRRLTTLKRQLSDSLRQISSKSLRLTVKALKELRDVPKNYVLCYIVTGVTPDGRDGGEEDEDTDQKDDSEGGDSNEAMSDRQDQPEKEQISASEAKDSTDRSLPSKKRRFTTPEDEVVAKRLKSDEEIAVDKGSQLQESGIDPEFGSQLVPQNQATGPLTKDGMESTSTKNDSTTQREIDETEGLAARILDYAINTSQGSTTQNEATRVQEEGLAARLVAYAEQTLPRENINTNPNMATKDTGEQEGKSLEETSQAKMNDATPEHKVQTTKAEYSQAVESVNPLDKSQTTEAYDVSVPANKPPSHATKPGFNIPETVYAPPIQQAPNMRERKSNMFARPPFVQYPISAIDLRTESREPIPTEPSLLPESPASPTDMQVGDLQFIGEYETDQDLQIALYYSIKENSAKQKASQGEQLTHDSPGHSSWTQEPADPESVNLEADNKRIIGEVLASDEDTIMYAEGDLVHVNDPPEVTNLPETSEKNEDVGCSYKREKFKTYPGIAKDPFNVKKDARYQKKFYKKKPVILPRKIGEAIMHGVDPIPYRAVSEEIQFETLSLEEKKKVSDWQEGNKKYVEKYMPEQSSDDSNDSPPSPVKQKKVSSEQSSKTDDNLPSVLTSSFSVESPTSSESPKCLSSENEQDYENDQEPSFIKALEKIKSLEKKSPKKLTTSPKVVKISASPQKSTRISVLSHRSYPGMDPELEIATIIYNEDLKDCEGAIYFRNYVPMVEEGFWMGLPIISPLFKIVYKTVSARHDTSVEEFLSPMTRWRDNIMLQNYKGIPTDELGKNIELCTPIPIRTRNSNTDGDYELVGDVLTRPARVAVGPEFQNLPDINVENVPQIDVDKMIPAVSRLDQEGKEELSNSQSIPTDKDSQKLESDNSNTRNESLTEYVEAERESIDLHSSDSEDTIIYMSEAENESGALESSQEDNSSKIETTSSKIMKTENESQSSSAEDEVDIAFGKPSQMQQKKSVGNLGGTGSTKPNQQEQNKPDDGIRKDELKGETKCFSPEKISKLSQDSSIIEETHLSPTEKDKSRILQSPTNGKDKFSQGLSCSSSGRSTLNKTEMIELSPLNDSKDSSGEHSTLNKGPGEVRESTQPMGFTDFPEGSKEDNKVIAYSPTHNSAETSENPSFSQKKPKMVELHPASDTSESSTTESRSTTLSPTGSSGVDASEEFSSSEQGS